MSIGFSPDIDAGADTDDVIGHVDEMLVDDIWRDLNGQIAREQIRRVALEIAAEFEDAAVTAFIPILIRRQAREKLRLILDKGEASVI